MVNPAPMLAVDGVNLTVGAFSLTDISLRLTRGDYCVVLGPTGCGKTLLAETLCGLNPCRSGDISIGGRIVTRMDPARRNIGYVPQDYALLPFKTVAQNIAFGLQARALGNKEIRRRVDEMLAVLDLQPLRDRYPAHLSGGERQRVALGRALTVRPDVLIMDEPLSALDEETCLDLMGKMAELHRELGTTTIHICHRLEEALTMGSTLVVMRAGRIEQQGTAEALCATPATGFVARFLRLPNRVPGEVRNTVDGRRFCVGDEELTATDLAPGPACGLYPLEGVRLAPTAPAPRRGVVVLRRAIGRNRMPWTKPGLVLEGNFPIFVPGVYSGPEWQAGREAFVSLPDSGWHILPDPVLTCS